MPPPPLEFENFPQKPTIRPPPHFKKRFFGEGEEGEGFVGWNYPDRAQRSKKKREHQKKG